MWQAVALASAGGGVVTFFVWQVFEGYRNHRAATRLTDRLRRLETRRTIPAPPRIPLLESQYSTLPMLQWLLGRLSLTPMVALFLQQAGSVLNVNTYLFLHVSCGLAGVLAGLSLHAPPVITILLGLLAGAAPLVVMLSKRKRRWTQLSEQLPEAIRLITSAMRAGLGLDVGLNVVATELPDPIRAEFRRLLNETVLESDATTAFRHLAQRVPLADFRLFAASGCLHREVGGNFAELLDQLEQTVRERFELFRELKTMTAEGRLSGWVLAVLPLVIAAGLALMSPGYLRPLFEQPLGHTLLWSAASLQLVGIGIIWWLIHPRIQ